MLPGLMQPRPLMISDMLIYAATAHPDREIVSRLVDEPIWRYGYQDMERRARRLVNILIRMGIGPGDRVSSLAWNTHRHLELFFAVPGCGAVLHTANPRLSDDHIAYTINHAGSRVLFYDTSFTDIVARLQPLLASVEQYVPLTGRVEHAAGYETMLAAVGEDYKWPAFDENAGAFLCYTSGTTGNPKGVLYSHRSVVLHGLAAGLNGSLGFSAFDCIMPCQSLYHATAWGLPFAAAINGCKLVLPCHRFDGESLHELIEGEQVTFSGGVPTIWTMYLDHMVRTGQRPHSLRRLVIGGSAVPRHMAETFHDRYGVSVSQIWGMTEMSPLGVVATPTPKLALEGEGVLNDTIWTRQGRLQFGVELKIVDEVGRELPRDGKSSGALLVRGPWVLERYFGSAVTALDAEGWFDTGDIATIDGFGFMRITDRKKDVIKSGGEWISSIDIENVAAAFAGVRVAAVIGLYHPKWEERPVLIVEPHEGCTIDLQALRHYLIPQMARWWLPDQIIVAPVPLTATGKVDKKLLRQTFKDALTSAEP